MIVTYMDKPGWRMERREDDPDPSHAVLVYRVDGVTLYGKIHVEWIVSIRSVQDSYCPDLMLLSSEEVARKKLTLEMRRLRQQGMRR